MKHREDEEEPRVQEEPTEDWLKAEEERHQLVTTPPVVAEPETYDDTQEDPFEGTWVRTKAPLKKNPDFEIGKQYVSPQGGAVWTCIHVDPVILLHPNNRDATSPPIEQVKPWIEFVPPPARVVSTVYVYRSRVGNVEASLEVRGSDWWEVIGQATVEHDA